MLPLASLIAQQNPQLQIQKLVDSLTHFMQQSQFSQSKTQGYLKWILRFCKFHNYQHPSDLNQWDIESYLSSLAIDGCYEPATQKEAAKAFYFLYQDFLQIPLTKLQYSQIKQRKSLLDRFGYQACQQVIQQLNPTSRLAAELALLGKLKLPQVTRLKLNDIDIKSNRICVRDTQGKAQFHIAIPIKLILDLRIQMMRVKQPFVGHASFNKPKIAADLLFPLTRDQATSESSSSMQLLLIKNDIKMAIKQYLNQPQKQNRLRPTSIVAQQLFGDFSRRKSKNMPNQIANSRQIAFELSRGAA